MKKFLFLSSLIIGAIVVLVLNYEKESTTLPAKVIPMKKQESGEINTRQNILLALLRQHKSLQMKEIEKRIQTVNVRTLRRDLDKLLRLGLISKTGSTKAAVYGVKK